MEPITFEQIRLGDTISFTHSKWDDVDTIIGKVRQINYKQNMVRISNVGLVFKEEMMEILRKQRNFDLGL